MNIWMLHKYATNDPDDEKIHSLCHVKVFYTSMITEVERGPNPGTMTLHSVHQ